MEGLTRSEYNSFITLYLVIACCLFRWEGFFCVGGGVFVILFFSLNNG